MTTSVRLDACQARMAAGDGLARRGEWAAAYREYSAAHDLGHGARTQHLAAHRAALKAAVYCAHPGRIFYQAVFLTFAFVTARR